MTPATLRELDWEGGANVRDLGGLPLSDGGQTRFGRVYRSSSPDELTAAGWRSMQDAGVTAILDLRGEHEKVPAPLRPASIPVITLPLEDVEDPFYAEWDGRHGSMDYFAAGMTHWPELWAAAAGALADLPEGAVLVHCAAGRDRTGAISALILDAAGVEREAIVDDYLRGIHGAPRPASERDAVLDGAREAMERFLDADRPAELDAALAQVAVCLR